MIISKIEFALDKYLATHICKLITNWINTHNGSQICYFVLIDFWIRNPVIGMTHRKEVPSLSLQNSSKLIICTGHEMIPRPGAYWILMEKYIHMLLQLEVSNYHNKLQPVSRGHLCTD